MGSIIRINFSSQATIEIRNLILTLALKPGERLILSEIGERLGISRTPVREALRSLIEEGLVTSDGVMYWVRKFSLKEIKDLIAIRRSLEILSAEQAAISILPEQIQSLNLINEKLMATNEESDYDQLIFSDLEFHRLISEASLNTQLVSLLERFNQQYWWISRYILSLEPDFATQSTFYGHDSIVEAISARNPGKAKKAMEKHLRESEKRELLKFIKLEELSEKEN